MDIGSKVPYGRLTSAHVTALPLYPHRKNAFLFELNMLGFVFFVFAKIINQQVALFDTLEIKVIRKLLLVVLP